MKFFDSNLGSWVGSSRRGLTGVLCLLCALESMFTKEDKLELERRQGGVTTIEASDLGYKAGWVWVGDKETGDWVWSETGEWPEIPKQ